MSTKIEHIETVHSIYPQVDDQIIEQHCGRAYNQLLFEAHMAKVSNWDVLCKTYPNVPVEHDEDTDTWYCLFPEAIAQLPDHAQGVRRVNAMKGKSLNFAAVPKDAMATFAQLVVSKVTHVIGYSVLYDRIEFMRKPSDTVIAEGVKMDIVIPFEKYDYEDVVYIPGGWDERFFELIAKFLQVTPPESKINN